MKNFIDKKQMHFTNGSRAMISSNLYILSARQTHSLKEVHTKRINILASHISQNIKHEIVFLWHPCLTWYSYVHRLKKVKFLKMKSIY